MMQTPAEVLDDLFELLKDPDHWTRGRPARLASDCPVHPTDPGAVKWCLIGGIHKVMWSEFYKTNTSIALKNDLQNRVIRILDQQLDGIRHTYATLASFNDLSTHAQVLDLIDTTRKFLREDC
jgi:hypothetical protein